MEELKARKQLVEAGKQLLDSKLVARTWGNVSCRLDDSSFVITPSGLDYMKTGEDDIVKMDIGTGQWQGSRKPSGERGIHLAAYKMFDDAGFVIHTHQDNATAIGLAGFETLDITDEERKQLGGISLAGYGLSGTDKLTKAVEQALRTGARTILMVHHGVMICGRDKADAMERAQLLEDICSRNIRGFMQNRSETEADAGKTLLDDISSAVSAKFGYAEAFVTPATAEWAKTGRPIIAQIDDMAQMAGRKIPAASDKDDILKKLERCNAVVFPDGGAAVVKASDEDDLEAMKLLVDKACLCAVHTSASGADARLGRIDTALQHFIYTKKYSKQKKGI